MKSEIKKRVGYYLIFFCSASMFAFLAYTFLAREYFKAENFALAYSLFVICLFLISLPFVSKSRIRPYGHFYKPAILMIISILSPLFIVAVRFNIFGESIPLPNFILLFSFFRFLGPLSFIAMMILFLFRSPKFIRIKTEGNSDKIQSSFILRYTVLVIASGFYFFIAESIVLLVVLFSFSP